MHSKLKPPLSRIVKEGTIGDCICCKSTTIKRFIFFGKIIGCINSQCKFFYKKYQKKANKKNKKNKIYA